MSRLLLLAGCLLLAAPAAHAQAKLSEPAVVSQTIDGTKITLEYSRPSLRGRTRVFGGAVHWNETWTPGANWATTLETDGDITVEGITVPKGKYSVWMVVKETGDWTLVLSSEARLFHTNRPTAKQEFARIPVTPRWGAAAVETLTWDFPVVKPDRAELRFQWATVVVPLRVTVRPTRTLTAEQRGRIVGTWAMRRGGDDEAKSQPERAELRIWEEGTRLRAEISPKLVGHESSFDLFVWTPSRFWPIHLDASGRPRGAESDLTVVFEFDGGTVKSVELGDASGTTLLKGPAK